MKKRYYYFYILFAITFLAASAGFSVAAHNSNLDEVEYTSEEINPLPYDISETGTYLPLGDNDISGPLDIGFTFNYYGEDYTTFRISANGFITLGSKAQDDGGWDGDLIPSSESPNNVIAGFWEDLNSPSGNIRYQVIGSGNNRKLVVGFYDVPHATNGPLVTFEIILYEETGQIEIICINCPKDEKCFWFLGEWLCYTGRHTIGIENKDGSAGLQILSNREDVYNKAWLISPLSNEPPSPEPYAAPGCLQPINNKYVNINIKGVAGDIEIISVTSDEPTTMDKGLRDLKHAPDAIIHNNNTVSLRAERSAAGDGRVYIINFNTVNSIGESVKVNVPHDRSSKNCEAINSGQDYDATATN